MKVAYLIQSHKNVPQLGRLVDTLTSLDPGCLVHVSHDRFGERDALTLQRYPNTVVDLAVGGRGRFHNVDRWLSGAQWVDAMGGADFVVLLSGQDYPVQPLTRMHEAMATSGDGFLEYFPVFDPTSNWPIREGETRYRFSWHDLVAVNRRQRKALYPLQAINRLQPFVRFNVAYDTLRVARRKSAMPLGLQCYGGSMFTTLSWRAVEHVLEVAQTRPDVMAWARRSLVIEEAFFQSILLSAGAFEFVPESKRFYKFSPGQLGSPAVLGADDIPEAVHAGCFFARKFDLEIAPEALDAADAAIASSETA